MTYCILTRLVLSTVDDPVVSEIVGNLILRAGTLGILDAEGRAILRAAAG